MRRPLRLLKPGDDLLVSGRPAGKRFSPSAYYAWAVLIVLLKRLRARVRQVARLFKRQRS